MLMNLIFPKRLQLKNNTITKTDNSIAISLIFSNITRI